MAKRHHLGSMNPRGRRLLKERLAEAQNWRCCHCGWRLDETPLDHLPLGPWIATFEHVIPMGHYGSDKTANLTISHNICNYYYGRVVTMPIYANGVWWEAKAGALTKLAAGGEL